MATGKQIRHYREKLGWTLAQLSDASDVDVGTISALEIRDSSRSKYFAQIAKALGLTLEQLSDDQHEHALFKYSDTADRSHATHRASDNNAPSNEPISVHGPTARPWPFVRVSRERLMNLKHGLGGREGAAAIDDIDRMLEFIVLKWEQQITTHKSAAG